MGIRSRLPTRFGCGALERTLAPTRCACRGRFILTLRGADALAGFEAARDRRVPRRFNDVSLFIDASGESGDHDALPHIPATDPATIPPDHGDARPDGSAG
jgi:hypothetical protein